MCFYFRWTHLGTLTHSWLQMIQRTENYHNRNLNTCFFQQFRFHNPYSSSLILNSNKKRNTRMFMLKTTFPSLCGFSYVNVFARTLYKRNCKQKELHNRISLSYSFLLDTNTKVPLYHILQKREACRERTLSVSLLLLVLCITIHWKHKQNTKWRLAYRYIQNDRLTNLLYSWNLHYLLNYQCFCVLHSFVRCCYSMVKSQRNDPGSLKQLFVI